MRHALAQKRQPPASSFPDVSNLREGAQGHAVGALGGTDASARDGSGAGNRADPWVHCIPLNPALTKAGMPLQHQLGRATPA